MIYTIFYDEFGGCIVPSPYNDGYQIVREENNCCVYDVDPEWWDNDTWTKARLQWCRDNRLSLCDIVERTYCKSEEGYEYKPIEGTRIYRVEFCFIKEKDAMLYKLFWG